MKEGVIIGCDHKAEWLLPWWWKHYSAHCNYPVTLIDFGMSAKGKKFCRNHGACISLDIDVSSYVNTIKPKGKNYENICGPKCQKHRFPWFKKPFACLKTPFEKSLWIDLDCQIEGSIAPIFNALDNETELALVSENPLIQNMWRSNGFLQPGEIVYKPECWVYVFVS